MKYSKGRKCEKRKREKKNKDFLSVPGPGAVQPVVVLFAHKKLFSSMCRV
jgi:hypothetical protein